MLAEVGTNNLTVTDVWSLDATVDGKRVRRVSLHYVKKSYALSAILDAFDGWAARTYNQSSRFGAMLDQLTDRTALMALCMTLCRFYPQWLFWLQMSAVIDIASHWLHLHATDLTRADSHKQSSNPVLHLYYTSRLFLGFMCAGNEAFYLLLYIRAFWPGPTLFGVHLMSYLSAIAFPIALIKSLISIVHMVTAAQTVVLYDTNQIIMRDIEDKKN
uniref:CDP-diacylglycerol--inositol 3-phosphatidyltransferase n=1 Tax=Heterorhabditis bacteriophora TaxID=37862 RepID=A0A1I7XE50_HETBA